jgi:hypothetical protein
LNTYLPYTGVGFEKANGEHVDVVSELAYLLGINGFSLRSGGYLGVSSFFESGTSEAFKSPSCTGRPFALRKGTEVNAVKEIYLAYRGFNNHNDDAIFDYSETHKTRMKAFLAKAGIDRAVANADSPFVQRDAMVRMYQLLGFRLNEPSKFMVTWTPDGVHRAEGVTHNTGPTGISIIMAQHFKIPVLNIGNEKQLNQVKERIKQLRSGELIKK